MDSRDVDVRFYGAEDRRRRIALVFPVIEHESTATSLMIVIDLGDTFGLPRPFVERIDLGELEFWPPSLCAVLSQWIRSIFL